MNAAIERYYFDQGIWPTEIDQLAKFLPDVPQACDAHASEYAIDSKTHRVVEVNVLQQAIDASKQAAAAARKAERVLAVAERAGEGNPQPAVPLPNPTTPRLAFEFVAKAAKNGEIGRVLDGFTELGQREIAGDLVDCALQDIAVGTHGSPDMSSEFQELKSSKAPGLRGSDVAAFKQGQLSYLRSIGRFMRQHRIHFAGLAKVYEPCEVGEIAAEQKWAVGTIRYSKTEVVREVILGFANSGGKWTICMLDEIPTAIREQLEDQLNGQNVL
jgi:hypothetical protein